MRYPDYAKELKRLLNQDQRDIKELSRVFYWHGDDRTKIDKTRAYRQHKRAMRRRTERMLQILNEIGEPSISNIGREGAIAISVLATHDALYALGTVLEKFEKLFIANRKDCQYQSIPAMTDLQLVLNRKPQRFGTRWLFDENKWPFLPTVEDFTHVNERRASYGIEPLRWPKDLSIPEPEQLWLKRPFTEMIMRDLTDKERQKLTEYL